MRSESIQARRPVAYSDQRMLTGLPGKDRQNKLRRGSTSLLRWRFCSF